MGFFAEVEGYELAADEELRVDLVFTSTGYFESLGLPIIQGRAFAGADDETSQQVVIVSESMAEKYWPNGDAVGGAVTLGRGLFAQVVGVAGNTTWNGLADDATNYLYAPLSQSPDRAANSFLTLAVRTDREAEDLLPAMRREIQALEPDLPIQTLVTMEGHVNRVLMPQRMGATLLSGFGLLALLLAAIGIAGVVAFSVNQKRRDIGVRIALGASGNQVLIQLMGTMTGPVLWGLAAGLVAARVLTRTVEEFMFRVDTTDPVTYLVIALMLMAVAVVATLLPARRAASVDPIQVLKAD